MKLREVSILDEAIADLEDGQQFYEIQRAGIGLYFVSSLLKDISNLSISAGIHRKLFDYFRLLSKKFPFAVYYDINNSIVEVVAILDMRRNPTSIKQILNYRKESMGGPASG